MRPCCAGEPAFHCRADRHITIRRSTPRERHDAGEFGNTGKRMHALRYVIVDADESTLLLGAFGLVEGASTKPEAVFWAERMASKNGWHFVRSDDFAGVVGALP